MNLVKEEDESSMVLMFRIVVDVDEDWQGPVFGSKNAEFTEKLLRMRSFD